MKIWQNPQPTAPRRDLVDPRSSSAPVAPTGRKTLLTDRRSTR